MDHRTDTETNVIVDHIWESREDDAEVAASRTALVPADHAIIVHEGAELAGYAVDGRWHIAMRQACRTLKLDWSAQRRRIMRDPILREGVAMITTPSARGLHEGVAMMATPLPGEPAEGVGMITTPSAGGRQDVTCLRLDLFWGWLFKLELSRLEPDVRAMLIPFQQAGYEALHAHFTGAPAAMPPTPADIDSLSRQVAQLSAAVAQLRRAHLPLPVVQPRPLHPIAEAILDFVVQVSYPVTAAEITRRLRATGVQVSGKYVSVRMRRLSYAGYLVHVAHGVYALPNVALDLARHDVATG